jgi:hypothetical protein
MELNIVIPVYNRLKSITRLINSLLNAKITGDVNLYISCEGNVSSDVLSFVKEISWSHGEIIIIEQSEQLGVDKHNLVCMKMSKKLGSVLVLEDDLVVSPEFQSYITACGGLVNTQIAGIGLYRYSIIEQNHFPFELMPNNEFVYYQQKACSKGTFYTWEMLEPYFVFLEKFEGNYSSYHLPENVQKWSNEVWEKSFYCYLLENNRYVAYPRYSLTTDFADIGVHMKKQTLKYVHQSPLYLSNKFGYISTIENTENVFDAFYELSPSTIKKHNKVLEQYDFETDLYGHKDLKKISTKYLLSSKNTSKSIRGWERRLKPEMNNILVNQEGKFYNLAKTKEFEPKAHLKSLKEDFLYYYPDTKLIDVIRMKIAEVVSRFF